MGVKVSLLPEPAVTDETGKGFVSGVLRILHVPGQVPAGREFPETVVTTGNPVAGGWVHNDASRHGRCGEGIRGPGQRH